MTIENEITVTVSDEVPMEKSAEQIASEKSLDLSINDNAESEQTAAAEQKTLIDANKAIREVLTIVPIGLHMSGLKNAAAAWSDDACDSISGALVPVLRKYAFGQKMLAYLETGGGVAEGVLIMALYPVAAATYAGYLVDKAEKEIKPEPDLYGDGKTHDAGTEKGSTIKFNEWHKP
jgi:hypothetical protein